MSQVSTTIWAAETGLRLRFAVPLAVLGGVLNALAFPGLGWWLLVGLLAGFAFWGTHILWITVYLGPAPWIALAGLEAIFFTLGCLLIALAWRFGARAFPGQWGRLGLTPVIVAGLWTLREYVSSNWPYGGFSWGRLAFSQSESPFGELVAWVGVSGLTFLIAWLSALLVQVVREQFALEPAGARRRGRAARSLPPVGLIAAMLITPAFPVALDGSLRVAAVQGDADAGLFAEYTPGEILRDHIAATAPLYGQAVDLVVWPENASDLDPLRNSASAAALDRVTERMRAPLITGTITVDGSDIYNSILLWKQGKGAVAQYDKIHPVPFAEYIPDRDFWYPLAPGLLSLIPRDYTLGTRSNVLDIDGVAAGIAICFDIVDDNLIRQMVADGANIILAPTNNADFGRTDESVQLLAIARLRAIETGRSVVNASTVGTSAIIAPDGRTIDRLPTFAPGSMVQDVPLSRTTTLATIAGQGIEWGASAFGLVGLLVAALLSRRRRRRLRRLHR